MSVKRVSIKKDDVSRVVKSITELIGKQVLVGFPQKNNERWEEGDPINNATLGYIHEFGSPIANIPARPFLISGVKSKEDEEVELLKKAADATLHGDTKSADQFLQGAGFVGEMAAKDALTNGAFVPLKPSTVRARRYNRSTKSMRDSEKNYLALMASGMSPGDAQDAAGIRPLIDTGQMRSAITHVIRKK